MNFIKTENTDVINDYRKELYKTFVAPLDSMWQDLYIASSQAYLIEKDNKYIGYCCIDNHAALLQVFVTNENRYLMRTIIRELIDSKHISSASLSTIEPVSFNACIFLSQSIKSNTFCYKYSNHPLNDEKSLKVELVTPEHSNALRSYYKEHVGFDDTFGYVDNLVSRKELYFALEEDTIIATGECRLSDTQLDYADVGVSVHTEHRKKGLATKMLQQMTHKAIEQDKKPICSTTIDNIGSQKAIERAGFYCSNIIFDISLI